jgi:hypothetical protein
MFALFNKNKIFIGYSPDIPENSDLLKIEIPESKSNITIWKWDGDYDNGKMVPISTGYPMEEIELERELFDYIDKRYPLGVQLANIIKQISKILKKYPDLEDDEFVDMSHYVLNAVDKTNKRIKYFKNHSQLISKDESERQFREAFGS